MPPLRHIHGRPPGTPSRCRPSATPSLRCVVRFGAQRNYRCPGQARRPSKFASPSFSAWSTPSATPPDTAHFRSFGEMLNQSAQIMVGGKSSLVLLGEPGTGKTSFIRHLLWHLRWNCVATYDEQPLRKDDFFMNFITNNEDQ